MAMRFIQGSSTFERDAYFLVNSNSTHPDEENSSSSHYIEAINITDLPKAMRVMGWKKSAAFMNRWLSSPAWECPESWKDGTSLPAETLIPASHCDEDTIKMSWLMGYPSASRAANELLEKACSPTAMAITAKRLKRLGWKGNTAYTFGRKNIIGRPSMSARELEQYYQNNFLAVGDNFIKQVAIDTLDDIYGSLGTYSLKSAVIGMAFCQNGKRYLEAQWVGIYVKDFYDFNNNSGWDQPLGLWHEKGIITRSNIVQNVVNGYSVFSGKRFQKIATIFNSDLLNYRDKTGKGGDFIVFSDVYWTKISGTYQLPWEE